MGSQLTRLRVGDGFKVRHQRRFRLCRFGFIEQEVLLVLGIALDVQLRRQNALAILIDRVVNVRCPTHIFCRLDAAEVVLTSRSGQESSEALEVLVHLFLSTLGVNVGSGLIGLPYFNDRVSNGIARQIQDASGQVCDFSDGWRDRVVEQEQVIVRIQGQSVGIEGTFGLACRTSQFFGEKTGRRKRSGGEGRVS